MNIKEKFIDICETLIKREGIAQLLNWLNESDFFTAPASTKFHGNFEGGLCEHSLNVFYQLLELNDLYADFPEETIAVVALFHDVCKVNSYKKSKRNVKDPVTGNWVTKDYYEFDEKMPLGHGEKSCILLQNFIKLSGEELLAIRWHMGGFDASVKGGYYGLSKAQDMSKLVTLLSVADLIASNFLEEKKE